MLMPGTTHEPENLGGQPFEAISSSSRARAANPASNVQNTLVGPQPKCAPLSGYLRMGV
jgi:hypothetical protein